MKELIIFGILIAAQVATWIIGRRRSFAGNRILGILILLQLLTPLALWAGLITWNVLDGVELLTGEGYDRCFLLAHLLGRIESVLLTLGTLICLGVLVVNGLRKRKGIANKQLQPIARQPPGCREVRPQGGR